MKIRELIAELQQCNPEHDVVLSSDPEGNNYSLCSDDVSIGHLDDRRGEWRPRDLAVEEGGCTLKQINAVCLYPVN